MNIIWNWIKTHGLLTLVGTCCVLLAVDISIRVWIMSGIDLEPYREGAAYFSNIATPIATIISVILFVWLTWNQYALIQSQSIKQNLEREYELIKKGFENEIYTYEYRTGELDLEPASKTFNSLNLFTFFIRIENDLKRFASYMKDFTDYNDGVLYDVKHYKNNAHHEYLSLIEFLNPFALHGAQSLDLVRRFLIRVNSLKLLPTDREYFHILIEAELLTSYFLFMRTCALAPNQFMIPLINKPGKDGKVDWISFSNSKISEHYEFLKKHLIRV